MSQDITARFAALKAGNAALRQTDATQRAAKIQRLLAATLARKDEIRRVVREELGCAQADIDAQLLMIKTEAEFICRHLSRWMLPQKIQGSIMSLGKASYVQYEPKGTVLVLGTWNAPYAISFVPAFGAIAAGNSVVIKPSELAPASAALIGEIVAAADIADTVIVEQGGAEVAQALLAQPINHVFYIGGHHVGRLVMKAAADHFASVTLEMGGKNPVVLDKSADIDDAARKISWGRLSNAGQICIAPEYVLAHDSVMPAFVEALKAAIQAQYNPDGRGFDQSDEFARIINERHHARIVGLIDDAVSKGATLAFGGEHDEARRYIAPTILTGVTADMKIDQEEVFGPILVVKSWSRPEQALAEIESKPKPLASYVFAKDRSVIDWFLAHTTSGSTVVNHNVIQSGTNPNLPFGGVNDSGMGRLGGHFSFLETANARAVVEEGPPLMDPNLMFPPYSDKYKKMIGDMLDKSFHMPDGVINAINGMIRVFSVFRR